MRNPAEAAFNADEFELGKLLEHPFRDQAHHLGHVALTDVGVFFEVAGWVPGRAGRPGDSRSLMAGMYRHRQIEFLSSLVDGMVEGIPVGDARRRGHDRLLDARMPAQAADLPGRRARVLGCDHQGAEEARVLAKPDLDQPVVVGPSHHGGVVVVGRSADTHDLGPRQDGVVDVIGIQQLLAHCFGAGAGRPASGGKGIAPQNADRIGVTGAGRVRNRESALAHSGGQIGLQIVPGAGLVVNIGVDQGQSAASLPAGLFCVPGAGLLAHVLSGGSQMTG